MTGGKFADRKTDNEIVLRLPEQAGIDASPKHCKTIRLKSYGFGGFGGG